MEKRKMPKTKFWRFINEASEEDAELLLYGEIASESWYEDDVTPRQFYQDLQKCHGKDLTVRINSPGGDIFAAQAIYTMLRNYAGNVTVHIDGMCASAATVVACAGEEVSMPRNALYMIHNPASFLLGTYDEPALQKLQKALAASKETIINVYTDHCKGSTSTEEISQLMDEETWLTAEEAMEKGFVNEIDEDYQISASISGNLLSINGAIYPRLQNKSQVKRILQKEKNKMGQSLTEKIANILGMETPKDTAKSSEKEALRIQNLNQLRDKSAYTDAIVNQAVRDGKTAKEIKPYIEAVSAVKSPADKALEEVKALIAEQMQSGAEGVRPQPRTSSPQSTTLENKQKKIDDVVNAVNKMRGGK